MFISLINMVFHNGSAGSYWKASWRRKLFLGTMGHGNLAFVSFFALTAYCGLCQKFPRRQVTDSSKLPQFSSRRCRWGHEYPFAHLVLHQCARAISWHEGIHQAWCQSKESTWPNCSWQCQQDCTGCWQGNRCLRARFPRHHINA